MNEFFTYTVLGIAVGCIYALTATGLVVTYITSGIFNFAHGAIGMIAAFAYWDLSVNHGWPAPVALIAVVFVLAPLFGALIDGVLMRRLHGTPVEVSLVITLGLLLLLLGVAFTVWDNSVVRILPEFFAGNQIELFNLQISYHQIIVILTAVAVAVGLRIFLYQTRPGIALRAVVDAPEVAALNGAAPARISMMGWAIGSMLAALAGILLAPLVTLDILGLTLLVINGYAAAMVGRLRSLPLTFGGGIALGLIETYATGYLPAGDILSQLHTTLPIVFLFAALLIFPERRLRVGRSVNRRPLRVPSLRQSLLGAGAFVAVAWFASGLLSDKNLYTFNTGLVVAVILLSLVLLTGYGGQISLCQLTFVGVGAFGMGKFADGKSILGLVAAVVVAGAVGAVMALPSLRLRGLYLALSTLAFAQFMTAAFFNNNAVFGQGGALKVGRISLPGVSLGSPRAYFVFCAIAFAAAAVAVVAIRRASFGRRLSAMGDSPAACVTLGVNLTWTKLVVFTASAGLAGFAGALYGGLQGQVGTLDFQLLPSLVLLLLAVIWGVDSIVGALVAGTLSALFPTIADAVGVPNFQYLAVGLGVLGLSRNPEGVIRQIGDRVATLRASLAPGAPIDADEAVEPVRPRPRPRPRRDDAAEAAVPALELRGVHAGYGQIEVVHGVDLVVPMGSVFALLGPNGAGKSTLLKTVSCTKVPTEGCVHIMGVHVNGASPESIARLGVCTIPEGRGIFANLTVLENLKMMSYREGVNAHDIAERAFARFPPLAPKRTQLAGTLSGGEQQMLAMARAVSTEPSLLLLDEISMGLAPLIVVQLYDLVRHLAEEGLSILVVEQFANTALAVADHAAVMAQGRITHMGDAAAVTEIVSEAYFGAPV
ncbi:MAG: branched-chain amino acid transport system permease protein livM [Acidimicrobiaceae bacterium]